ncbi:MAG: hypothetical protein IKP37_00935 [Paludibacteraceae bacterium]|nr:hypothetical protein [Paludibacteraceae bacterium]
MGSTTYWPALSDGNSIHACATLNSAIIAASRALVTFANFFSDNVQSMPHAGNRNDRVIIITIIPWSALPSVAMRRSFPQNMGRRSAIEWLANPPMVSNHKAKILLFLFMSIHFVIHCKEIVFT